MTEREAWLYLAERWDRTARHNGYSIALPQIGGQWSSFSASGLCYSVTAMCESGRVSEETKRRMRQRLQLFAKPHGKKKYRTCRTYWWDEDNEGAEHRAWACMFLATMPGEIDAAQNL